MPGSRFSCLFFGFHVGELVEMPEGVPLRILNFLRIFRTLPPTTGGVKRSNVPGDWVQPVIGSLSVHEHFAKKTNAPISSRCQVYCSAFIADKHRRTERARDRQKEKVQRHHYCDKTVANGLARGEPGERRQRGGGAGRAAPKRPRHRPRQR